MDANPAIPRVTFAGTQLVQLAFSFTVYVRCKGASFTVPRKIISNS